MVPRAEFGAVGDATTDFGGRCICRHGHEEENACELIGLREKSTGNTHISWEHLWFPVDFPLSQPIDHGFPDLQQIIIYSNIYIVGGAIYLW